MLKRCLQNGKEELDVEVKHYKLPKFEVEVEAPQYVDGDAEGLTVTLKAK